MTKLILVLLIALGTINALADSVEAVGGSITYHIIDNYNSSQNYVQKLSPDGRLIYNSMYGIRYNWENDATYTSVSGFIGNNSVGQPMEGAMASFGMKTHGFYFGGVLGAYIQNDDDFSRTGSIPFRITNIGSTGVVPVAGAEINYRLNLSDAYYLKLNNIISPVLTNTTVSLGYTF